MRLWLYDCWPKPTMANYEMVRVDVGKFEMNGGDDTHAWFPSNPKERLRCPCAHAQIPRSRRGAKYCSRQGPEQNMSFSEHTMPGGPQGSVVSVRNASLVDVCVPVDVSGPHWAARKRKTEGRSARLRAAAQVIHSGWPRGRVGIEGGGGRRIHATLAPL